MIDLTGQHVFIAGGSRGIGASAAKMAAEAGADITINYRVDSSAAKRVMEDVRALGRKALAVQADISVESAMERATDEAVANLGPLTGMVISASIFEPGFIQDMTAAFWDRVMGTNLKGTFLAVKAAARHLKEGGKGGSIIIYTSTAGQRGSAEYSAYATSKGGQIMFMRSMAKELGPDRIRVNCIAPAWTETDMAAPSLDVLGRENIAKDFALGRIGLPEDAAGATVFLLSDLASFITGSTITVDGGMDMRG